MGRPVFQGQLEQHFQERVFRDLVCHQEEKEGSSQAREESLRPDPHLFPIPA